ncbi:MAG: RNA polymerase sigma factor [Candidatus Saccharibacteria bacterium]
MLEEKEIQSLVKRAQGGESEAFGRLYDVLSQRLYNFLYSKLRHRETAEDMLHTVFLKAWSNLNSYKPRRSAKFSTWLFQIANYTLIDHWRTRKEVLELDKLENMFEFSFSDKPYERYDYLYAALSELPPDHQTVLLLRFRQDLSVAETAEAMHRNELSVRVLQHRALKNLKKVLTSKGHAV